MNKKMKNIFIKKYCQNNINEYNEFLNSNVLPFEFNILEKQRLEYNKEIFIMFFDYEKKGVFRCKKFIEPIGYCIVEDTTSKPIAYKEFFYNIYNIPADILDNYPTVISDCMIAFNYRRLGYGRQLAEYVVHSEYKNQKISLHAVEDGVYFWDKIGFEYIDGMDSVMVIKGGEHNA